MVYSFCENALGTDADMSPPEISTNTGSKRAKRQYSGRSAMTQGFLSSMQITTEYGQAE